MTTRVARSFGLAFVLALLPFVGVAQTATTNPEDEYKKLVKVDTEIQPLGETPFGESINPYDGSLSLHVVDVTVPGNGPTIELGRTFHADGDAEVRWNDAAFGDWELDIPRLTTMTSNASTIIQGPNQIGWLVNSSTRTDRCSTFVGPPAQRIGRPGSDPLASDDWWNEGYTLYTPGNTSEDMLSRRTTSPAAPQDGTTYVAVSKGLWHLGCLASTANGEAGEAFLAKGPDGTKVWLNQLVYRPARGYRILRRLGLMMATRVEDRFGNALTYTYNGAKLTRIDGSDGRQVTLDYTSDGLHVAHINVVTANATRTWTYGYTAVFGGSVLSSVTLPDGSGWAYNLGDLTYDVKSTTPTGHCLDPAAPDESISKVGTITGPSGAAGRFELRPTRHARSDVFEYCDATNATTNGTEHAPRYTNNLAVRAKSLSGAGIGTLNWTYSYPVAAGSWRKDCQNSGCSTTSYSEMIDPSGNTTRFTFSNRADASEGKALKTEYFNGGTGGAPVRTETLAYASASQGPWPTSYGLGFNIYANRERQQSDVPLARKDIAQDGDTYTWQALTFDAYARPATTRRNSSFGYSVDEAHAYQDDTTRGIIGLPLQESNLTTGEVVSRNTYDASTLTLASRAVFGQAVMNYAFNAQGQLASFTDANQHTTTLSNYKRGIPQSIAYPDQSPDHPNGTSQSIAVDDFGQITSITDQAGATTQYTYDAIGRVARIDYPAGDTVAWAPRVLGYSLSGDARGMGGSHWVRTVTQANYSERTDFDVFLRPVMNGKSEVGTGALYVSDRTEYDWKGRKTFVAYPVDGAPDRSAISVGVSTVYDALGRATGTTQPSELNKVLTTNTQYLSGGRRQDTDARGNATVTAFQAFDAPGYDRPVRVDAPEGVTQVIARDVYGNPLSLAQGGVTKTMAYDAQHRLCRSWEPETGSAITAYDAASNVSWTASGIAFNGSGCGYDQATDAAKVKRSYDGMNRVTAVMYPQGTLATSFSYDRLGNPASATAATSGPSPNSTGTVTWSFGRNKLGLLTAEVLAVDGWSWAFSYSYDANGKVSNTQYPDGENVAVNPNALGQPTTAGRFASGATYMPDGQTKTYGLSNGALYSAEPNARQLLRNFTFGTAANLAVSEDFTYDEASNLTQINDRVGSGQRSRTMSYDNLNRLTSAAAGGLWGTETYTYDTLNNLRSIGNSGGLNTYGYDANNRLTTITNGGTTVHTFQYDARGNTVIKDGAALNFDIANRLLSLAGKGDYLYDAAGRRVRSMTPSGTTYYAYNSAGQLVWQYDQATANGTDYIHLGKTLVASKKASTSAVMGNIDGVTTGANATISGWACASGLAQSIDVHLYVGGPAGSGTGVGAYTANQPSETAVQTACHSSGTKHRFSIPLTDAQRVQYAGKAIYVHGISLTGGGNNLLAQSGTFVIPPSVLAPSSPASISAAAAGDLSNIAVNWSATGNTTSYKTECSTNSGPWATLYTGTGTSAFYNGPGDATYQFRASACNANGCSTPTVSSVVTIAHIPPAPASISVPANSTGAVAVSWPATTYATSYQVDHSTNGNWANVWSGTSTSTTVNEGTSGNWSYRVRACNANGCGGYATSGGVIVMRPPGTPTITGGGTSNTGAYTISWSTVSDATSYNLGESVNGSGFQRVQWNASTSWSTSGRGNGTYAYQVQGCNDLSCGPWSNVTTVTVSLVPSAPPAPTLTTTYHGPTKPTVLVKWTAQSSATRYELMENNTQVYNGSALSYSSLQQPGVTLTYKVRACNAVGCSAYSPSNSVSP
ncbi:hypothetical protein [Xanthomonas sp. NCPPB 2632]|uniref:hypothetical protein n=1 Tax=Xanthomonas sp. NCPPB 2632 TaxID=3240912 RepID=UPI0035135AFB